MILGKDDDSVGRAFSKIDLMGLAF
jgi:hypothetical protein